MIDFWIQAKPIYFRKSNLGMNIYQIKKLLRKTKKERLKLSRKVKGKIENIHCVDSREVLENLRNPTSLKAVEQQPSRGKHDETYGLCFEISKRRKLFIVVTYKKLKKQIIIVTAFPSRRKVDRIIKRVELRKVRS